MRNLGQMQWILKLACVLLGPCFRPSQAQEVTATMETPVPRWNDHWAEDIGNYTLLFSSEDAAMFVDSNVNLASSNWLAVYVPRTFVWKFEGRIQKTNDGNSSHIYVLMLYQKYIGEPQGSNNGEPDSTRNSTSKKESKQPTKIQPTPKILHPSKYKDPHIAVNWDRDLKPSANYTLKFLSRSWAHAKTVYNTVQNAMDPLLSVYFHGRGYTDCRTSLETVFDLAPANVHCGNILSDAWLAMSQENQDALANLFPSLILQSANQTQKSAFYNQIPLRKLIILDTYITLRMFKEAHDLLHLIFPENEVQSGGGKFWTLDWFLPIYTQHGGVSVVNDFLNLLVNHWKSQETNNMNAGQLIHFWSAAAGTSVLDLAWEAFGQNNLDQNQLDTAKKNFLLPAYTCYDCYYDRFTLNSTTTNGLIYGTSTAFIFIVITTVVVSSFLYRRKARSLENRIRELTNDEIDEFFEGNSNITEQDGYTSIESTPFNKEFELEKDHLEVDFENVLGSGEFGLVLRGKLQKGASDPLVVAVKTVKPDVDITCFKALLMELKVLCFLESHSNIASLLGTITVNIKKREVYVAIEFCAQGDLLGFLKKHRNNFKNLFPKKSATTVGNAMYANALNFDDVTQDAPKDDETVNVAAAEAVMENNVTTLDLLEWSSQIANGMAYIGSKKVIHGDLAARNVLLTAGNVAKISDFGLSRQLLNYSNYMKTTKTPLPWRWMAIESLRDMNFSVESDVWAFGATLYEIFSLGTVPYAGWTWDYEFIDKLVAGQRLSEPEFANQDIYCIMLDCMKSKPEDRVTFAEIFQRFEIAKASISPHPKDSNYYVL